jgi:hypothetical protein
MKRYSPIYVLLLLLGFLFTSCSFSPGKNAASPVTSTAKAVPVTIPKRLPTEFPLITATLPSTLTPTRTITPTTSVDCPRLLPTGSPVLPFSFSVLFTFVGPGAAPGVWGVSANSTEARLVFKPAPPTNQQVKLSPDGSKLAWNDFEQTPETLVVDDLATQKETRYPWPASWKYLDGWTEDNRVKIWISGTHPTDQVGKGLEDTYAYFDLRTGSVETETIKIDLPEYDFMPKLGGGSSIDPSGEVVLYTAFAKSAGNDILLMNIKTGQILWSQTGVDDLVFPVPDWTKDGSRVLFAYWDRQDRYMKIFVLSRDGQQLKELKDTSLANQPCERIRSVNWLPDERFIYYAMRCSGNEGPAFIVDTVTTEVREICTPGYRFVDGMWSPDSRQFVYALRKGDDYLLGGQYELRLLDMNTWTTQIIAVGDELGDIRFIIVGWTPVTIP